MLVMEAHLPLHLDRGAIPALQPGGEWGAAGPGGLFGLGASVTPVGRGAHPSRSGFQPQALRWSRGITRRHPLSKNGKFMCV